MAKNKFLITNSSVPEWKFWIHSGFDFMDPELFIAANDHYEVYSILFKTIKEENGEPLRKVNIAETIVGLAKSRQYISKSNVPLSEAKPIAAKQVDHQMARKASER